MSNYWFDGNVLNNIYLHFELNVLFVLAVCWFWIYDVVAISDCVDKLKYY